MSQDTAWPAIQTKQRLDVGIRLQVPALISLAQVKRETGARFVRNTCAAPATVSDAGVSASHCELLMGRRYA